MLRRLKILYEDADIIVLDKPAGVKVHPVRSGDEPSLINLLKDKISSRGFLKLRQGVVHRLDADTSGVMVFAKHVRAAGLLSRQFKERTVAKKYLSLVHGKISPRTGMIELPIGRSRGSRMSVYAPKGKESRTGYEVLSSNGTLSLIELTLHTGRTHQIRAHLAAIGFPIVGDKTYGSRSRDSKVGIVLGRQFLHSSSLELTLPSGRRRRFESKLPGELHSILSKAGLYFIRIKR